MATQEKKERLITPIGRACFVHVFEPHAVEEGKDKKYSLLLVFEDKDVIAELRKKCIAAATAKFTDDGWRKLHKKGKFRFPWRDASEYEDYGEPFTTDGAIMCNFQSTTAPGVVDKRAKPILNREEVYSGMLARVTYAVWPYDSNGNKGITLLLNNVQKTGDGERLSGKPSAEDDFEAIDGGETDPDDDLDI